ncbi:hypothetical protein ABB37_04693 [Leptomonas pyrrhocoris]|uniref:PSP1 C-terminal domain-containing protein n=1 Tax=Leptomonas pyrrhocoris TaxID=157538 RepID=A0A0N0VF88_LEPPY|nr:hypothetical protein ABB37_04693 [Leptomonas pyrrhocoris]KPA80471.1 hypothetical protein ABB37_04693 [Leptomonas pyrrhocoris]|eukprot:XP_015658910.1 hypothetical protein ABB37_04693 [Leptomonas pyrrhocoris]
MPPMAATAAGKPPAPAHATYPLVNVNEPPASSNNDAINTSSPLRYSHAGGRGGCYVSHSSATSFFNYSNKNTTTAATMACVSAGPPGASRIASFPSNELQEYISMTSPASDFYYYSPQPFYLESPAPCAAAELYGHGSPGPTSFAAYAAMQPASGPYCYNSTDPAFSSACGGGGGVAASAGTNTPSLMSSMSFSGSRFPQWYLPRGLYGSSMAAATGAGVAVPSVASGVYGTTPLYGYASPAPANASVPCNSVEDDALSCEENFAAAGASCRYAQELPVPPRLSPQCKSSSAGGSLSSQPSMPGSERAPQASAFAYRTPSHYGAAGLSAEASPAQSPTCRPARSPQFVSYDGRAYGLPVYRGISCADAAIAISRSALVADTPDTNVSPSRSVGGGNHQGLCSGAPRQAMMVSGIGRRDAPSGAVLSSALPSATPPEAPAANTPASAEGATTQNDGADEEEEVYSPEEKALLVDAHTRLAKLRAKAHEEQQQQQQRQARSALSVWSSPATSVSSPSTMPTSVERGSTNTAVSAPASGKPTLLAVARRQSDAEAQRRLNESAHSAGTATDIPVSPIPHLPGYDDADTARLEDSMLEGMNLSQEPPTEGDADGATRAVLERVLSLRGVKWRHDPYSRRVLAHPSSPTSTEDDVQRTEDGENDEVVQRERSSERCRNTPPSSRSRPASPDTLSRSCRQPLVDAAGRKRPTPDESTLPSSESTTLTQPPASPNVSQHTQDSRDGSADETSTQPSVRRMPIKKVCVRHFVGGKDGELSASADGAVGMLAKVVSQLVSTRPSVSTTVTASTKTQADASVNDNTLSKRSSSTDHLTVTTSGPQESVTVATSSPLLCTARPLKDAVGARSSPLVPSPRSKHHLHRDVNEGGAVPRALATAMATNSHTGSTTDDSSNSDSRNASNHRVSPASSTEPVLRQMGPYASFGPDALSASSGESRFTSWTLRARLLQGLPAAAAAVATPASSLLSHNWGHKKATCTADVDTRLLVQLWRTLDASGCFRDVLEARQHKLGTESNSSSRVTARNVARRFSSSNSRNGAAGEEESGGRSYRSQQQQHQQLKWGMLTEEEVTHVYVLRHRYRSSCAVAACRYDCGTEVVVDGDMGVDTGVVVLVMTKAEYDGLSPLERRLADLSPELSQALTESIHRPLTAEERHLRNEAQRPLEDATLDFVRYLATQPHLFHSCRIECMNFVAVEFQADGQKLYVYYQTSSAVRFLELATYLNHIFHCRIWMKMAKGC